MSEGGLRTSQVALASDTWESYIRAYNALTRRFQADGSFEDVSMREYDVLYTLAKAPRPLAQSELVEAVILSQPALSRLLVRLECQGLIRRAPHSSDRRASVFALTEQGIQTQRRIGRAHGRAIASALYSALDAEDVEELKSLCDRLNRSPEETDE